ncbi:hypothetical protein TPHA_0O00150 [Tetrapisispora phaffii CBS 4417]|uniref:Glycosyltransferase family 32 protein n=1 Tax=Tetrapisispora phaffii (strain ATCC 24235 / CBS 4417 / NBRC 1672 / NRRL Y-8282 / UCD 70-5) TaxID=1071381 RepID=G8C1F9_TETPH|nr:hypothetical protein TPHA_0O00150 [Tetrapisispora phaffii CBS 4417]CCE65987.1 hypothetical protein TPHA_0O00150 [Tetrapisispora phaffii CBS 4417]
MTKLKRGAIIRRLVVAFTVGFFILIGLFKLKSHHKDTDLNSLIPNLPIDIRQNLLAATNDRKHDTETMQKFEELFKEIKKNQEEQSKQLEKQRRLLDSKIQKIKVQNKKEATLRESLAFTYEYDQSRKLPAYIWQLYPTDKKQQLELKKKIEQARAEGKEISQEMSDTEQVDLNKWEAKNPGFVHEVFNHVVMKALVQHFYANIPAVVEAFETLPSDILKVDFFKYLILYARGGVYADIDTDPIQAIPNWIPENVNPKSVGLLIGIEHDAELPGWENFYVRRLQFGTWIIQAKPGHPIIKEVIARITEETLKRKRENNLNVNLRNNLNLMSWTGSALFTDTIFAYFNNYLKSGISTPVTWREFHKLTEPVLLSDVLVFPRGSFNVQKKAKVTDQSGTAKDKLVINEEEADPLDKILLDKSLQLVSHNIENFWKAPKQKVDQAAKKQ